MASIFLSYSREDLPLVQQLERGLTAEGVFIWRDQEQIYGGAQWPKRLGEAISAQDVFLLVWSKQAALSYYVEFEWCTAIALKKRIIPCCLDDTPLPASLKTFHGSDARQLSKAIANIVPWIREPQARNPEHITTVLKKLGDIRDTHPQKVVEIAKAIFDQRNWVVHGSVIQGENVTVTIGQGTGDKLKTLPEKWQAWVVLVGGILAAILTASQIKEKIWSPPTPDKTSEVRTDDAVVEEQPLAGTIFGERDKRLSGVQVTLPEFKKTAITDEKGRFEFTVHALPGQQVELVAEKSDYETMERFVSLGNQHNDFTMVRMHR
jgi:hypothetical protein